MKSLKQLGSVITTLAKEAGYATGKGYKKAKDGIVGIVKKGTETASKISISAFFNNIKAKAVQLDENLAHSLEKTQEKLENRHKPIPDRTWKVIKDTVNNIFKDLKKNGEKGVAKLDKIIEDIEEEKGGK